MVPYIKADLLRLGDNLALQVTGNLGDVLYRIYPQPFSLEPFVQLTSPVSIMPLNIANKAPVQIDLIGDYMILGRNYHNDVGASGENGPYPFRISVTV